MKKYVVGIHQERLAEALLMCTHDIGFHGGIRKKYYADNPHIRSYVRVYVTYLSGF